MDRTEKFEEDLESLTSKLVQGTKREAEESLFRLRDTLLMLHKSNVVKINHSVMELVCAKLLILKGYLVEVEHQLEGALTCDLYATKGEGNLVAEIETGFIPPEHALDPSTYLLARIASKITRYSNYTSKFALGIPPQYALQVPEPLLKSPRDRTDGDLSSIKSLCDRYYKNPPVTLDDVKNARLHGIYLINVDKTTAQEIDPGTYVNNQSPLGKTNNGNSPGRGAGGRSV
jgi:hypothetical protein